MSHFFLKPPSPVRFAGFLVVGFSAGFRLRNLPLCQQGPPTKRSTILCLVVAFFDVQAR